MPHLCNREEGAADHDSCLAPRHSCDPANRQCKHAAWWWRVWVCGGLVAEGVEESPPVRKTEQAVCNCVAGTPGWRQEAPSCQASATPNPPPHPPFNSPRQAHPETHPPTPAIYLGAIYLAMLRVCTAQKYSRLSCLALSSRGSLSSSWALAPPCASHGVAWSGEWWLRVVESQVNTPTDSNTNQTTNHVCSVCSSVATAHRLVQERVPEGRC